MGGWESGTGGRTLKKKRNIYFPSLRDKYFKTMANTDNVRENINLTCLDSHVGIPSQENKTNLESEPTQQHLTHNLEYRHEE